MRRTFGLSEFRPGQQDGINAIVSGRDAVAVMPTSAGKSLCSQLPALHLPGTTIVVSPLIALMKDQADKLNGLNVTARAVHSTLGAAQLNHGATGARDDDFDVLEKEYTARQEADRTKLERMAQDAHSACRWQLLLSYFGEDAPGSRAGLCDNCVTPLEERLRA